MGGHDGRPVVVLADDDEAITSNLAPFLDRAGFTVHIAPDGEAALDLVERLDPDGCILDVLMPRTGGRYCAGCARPDAQELARGRAARSLPGTGIGLALVRVIAGRHEGRVAIRSREGQGTVVSIRLPAPDRARTAPAVAGLRQHRDTPDMAAG